MNSRERFQKAARCEPLDRPPVWMMRQAGRTLPEYRELREKHSFWDSCRSPELAAEITLQPMRRFPLDAAVIFSDILVVPDVMGAEVSFSPLSLSPKIVCSDDVKKLKSPDVQTSLGYVARAIQIVNAELKGERAVLGFSGAPYTLATYMVEGGPSKEFNLIKGMMFQNPATYGALMERLTDIVADYMTMQIEAGAAAVQLFDTWAGQLGPDDFEKYVLPYVQRIIERLKPRGIPVIYYINGIGTLLGKARQCDADVFGIDWRVSLSTARGIVGADRALQGNLDPNVLFASPEFIADRVKRMLAETGGVGHIVNLGHGLLPNTPLEGIESFVNAVQNYVA